MAFAIRWLAKWSGQDPGELLGSLPVEASQPLERYRGLLTGSRTATQPRAPLLSIFSRVQDPDGSAKVPARYWRPEVLSLKRLVEPGDKAQARLADPGKWWKRFGAEAAQVLKLPRQDGDPRFEAFTYLLHKWAWAVPCSYGEPGVSLYDEFRALSALVHASGCAETPAGEFLLVGGDIPGIQKTIYTITSKGAAKGLRGRSFFIQLLSDAIVRRLLAELDLPETNVVYAAGGNFMLLAPMGTAKTVEMVSRSINQALLKAFEGDLALCLAWEELPATEVGSEAFASRASRALKQRIGQQKRRRFAEIAAQEWDKVFGPQGQGKPNFCVVCQHEQQGAEQGQVLEDGGWKCDQCLGFEELAQDIGQDHLLMFVSAHPPTGAAKGWQRLLVQLTGQWYAFASDLRADMPPGTRIYSINPPDLLDKYARGFHLIANTTPRKDNGAIQTFEELADGARGLKKVGVLRMDVDDLGRVLTQWLPERTMASTSALSQALDRFFGGWLDAICREVMTKPQMKDPEGDRGNLLYVIYAGGDDLFVVGAWDLMPLLAKRVQQRFAAYVGANPFLHISAGITLEDRKFPLYQAAERAGKALDHGAKEMPERQVDGCEVKKNAVSFLGKVVGWERYPFVVQLAETLIELTEEHGVPRSLLTTMRTIHDRYNEDVRQAQKRGLEGVKIYYGPWMWRKVYQLARIRERYKTKPEIAKAIENLESNVLTRENMPDVGLATRWAEYLTRGGKTR